MRVLTLDLNKKVTDVKIVGDSYINVPGLQPGEIINDSGEQGQIMQADGTFITPPVEPIAPQPYQPTNAEVAQMISDLQADLVIAGVI